MPESSRSRNGVSSRGVQFYNLLNHPNFQNPGTTMTTSSTLGFITTALGPGNSACGSGLGGEGSPRIEQ